MPSFCRHNRLLQNCAICSREQGVEPRSLVSGGAIGSREDRERREREPRVGGRQRQQTREPRSARARATRTGGRGGASAGVRVSRLERAADDGFRSGLAPGLKSSADAERLAGEVAFAAHRLQLMSSRPVGLWADVAAGADLEERTWLAFMIAYIGPRDEAEPFASIGAARISWAAVEAGEEPRLQGVEPGPRGAYDGARATAVIVAYRSWAQRAGGQQAAFQGEPGWTPTRRFERVFERLALPGLHRDARFELLVSLGYLGLYELRAGSLQLGGENQATLAAKRAFGIGDPILLEHRAAELAEACEVPLDALDLALHNWGVGRRYGAGIDPAQSGEESVREQARDALGLS